MRMTFLPRLSASHGHGTFLVVAAWGVTTAVGLVIVVTVASRPTHAATAAGSDPMRAGTLPVRSNLRPGTLPVRNNEPLIGGRKMTVADARTATGYPIPLPDTSVASQANLTQTWMDSKHEVALVFDNGKITITIARAIYKDPTQRFETFIRETRGYGKASMGRMHGQPVLVIEPNTDAPKSNPAWVEFYRDGIDINVYSHDYGTATLLEVASSMY